MTLVRSRFGLVLSLLALDPGAVAQQSNSPFDAATAVLPAVVMPFRRLADFDLDGDVDAVNAQLKTTRDEYRLALAFNSAGEFSWHFVTSSATPAASSPFLIEVGNLNGDAYPDICIVHGVERHDWLTIRNRPRQYSLERQAPITLAEPATTLALADMDGDGLDDVLWTDAHRLRLQTSSGRWTSIRVGGHKHGLRVLPRGGPFGSDLVLVNVSPPPRGLRTGDDDVLLFYGHRSTRLVAGPVFATGIPMTMIDTGDVDGDGDVDAVVFGMTSYRILRRLNRRNWVLEPELAGGPAASLHDVDGDGDLDGVCCSNGGGGSSGSYAPNVQPSDFQVSLNDGGGRFAPAFAIPGVGSPELAGVADVDLDGDADLVAGRCVYYADGPVRPLRASAVVPPCSSARALSDYDADGDWDVGFSVDSVYSNDGTGAFTLEPCDVRAPVGATLRGPGYSGDFDGDGDVDLVAEVRPGRTLAYATDVPGMELLRNDGRGRLLAPVPASSRGVTFALDDDDPEKSLLVDADLDGDLDLVTRTATIEFRVAHSRLWANQGTGFFRDGGSIDLRALWMGDVDSDGDVDLIGSGSGYEGTSTYLYLGSNPQPGQLPRLRWSGVVWHQRIESGIAVGDWNHDGSIDFGVSGETWSQGVFPPYRADLYPLLLNNRFGAGGTLVRNEVLRYNPEPDLAEDFRIGLSDLNGDLEADALFGPLAGDSVPISVLRFGVGGGLFSGIDSAFQLVSPGLLVDLDGDGDRDVLGRTIAFNRAPR